MNEGVQTLVVENAQTASLQAVPIFSYLDFSQAARNLLASEGSHCVHYYAYPFKRGWQLICAIANDRDQNIKLLSCLVQENQEKNYRCALSREYLFMHVFEREIFEQFGISFAEHPWLKPLRFPWDRKDQNRQLDQYPFYQIKSDELHEVGVGPIHAGIIEPGYFRFICHGEKVLHLEIQLGWQHRGLERLFLEKKDFLQRQMMAESIAGDTVIGHGLAFVQLMESLGGIPVPRRLSLERSIALELERIAMHVGDLGALCNDIGYQIGSAVFGSLRTCVINFFQSWCGNRFAKGLLRVGGTHYPLTENLRKDLEGMLKAFERRFEEMSEHLFILPSALERFDGVGQMTLKQSRWIGSVGMTARASGLLRDIRCTHPFSAFKDFKIQPVVLETGDVFARGLIRKKEIEQSIELVWMFLNKFSGEAVSQPLSQKDIRLKPQSLAVSLTEAWRGEIAHSAITDGLGEIRHYKIKDPSLHNWSALALAIRDQEISDFPLCNKSFNLSYCGHDL